MSAPPALRVYPDAESVARAGADAVLAAARAATKARPAAIAVSGGSTPLRMFAMLAQAAPGTWEHVHVFWADERCVPPDDAASNFRAAKERWLGPAAVHAPNVHRIRGELRPGDAADDYESDLRAFFAARGETRPAFDLVLLGMGADGHTASLFPGGGALDVRDRWAVTAQAPVEPRARVTLTLPGLSAASRIVFLVTGADKQRALGDVLRGVDLPAARVPRPEWFVDAAAAPSAPAA